MKPATASKLANQSQTECLRDDWTIEVGLVPDGVLGVVAFVGTGLGESSPPVGSPDTVVVGAVLAHARVGDAETMANVSAAANAKLTCNRSSSTNPRFPFISLTNFPAGEGSDRGRPVAIPWPGARV